MAGDNKDKTKKSASTSTTTAPHKAATTTSITTTTANTEKTATTPSRSQKEKARQSKRKRLADYSDSDDQDEDPPRPSRAEFLSLLARVNSMEAAATNRAGPSKLAAPEGQLTSQGSSLLLPPAPEMDDFQPVTTQVLENTPFPPPVLPSTGANPQMAAMYAVPEVSQAPPPRQTASLPAAPTLPMFPATSGAPSQYLQQIHAPANSIYTHNTPFHAQAPCQQPLFFGMNQPQVQPTAVPSTSQLFQGGPMTFQAQPMTCEYAPATAAPLPGDKLPDSIKEKIRLEKYVDFFDIFFPDSEDYHTRTDIEQLLVQSLVKKKRRQLTYPEWQAAFYKFTGVYLGFYPQQAQHLNAYGAFINWLQLHQYNWAMYDTNFRKDRETARTPWTFRRADLQTDAALHSRRLTYGQAGGQEEKFRHQNSNNPASPWKVGYCIRYNRQDTACPNRHGCQWKHACPICDGKHPHFRHQHQHQPQQQSSFKNRNSNPDRATQENANGVPR